jgi:AraC family transcriptional regulator, ethanolamine operon transcriptional activator
MSQPDASQPMPITSGNKRFQDIDELQDFSSLRLPIKLTQMSLQQFDCTLVMVDFGEAQFFFGEASCPVRCMGTKTRDFLDFTLPMRTDQPGILSHQYQLSTATVNGFDPDRDIKIVVPPHQLACFLRIKRSLVEDCLEAIGRPEIATPKFLLKNYAYMPQTLPPVRAYLNDLMVMLQNRPDFLHQAQVKQLVLEDFVPLFLNAIPPEQEFQGGISAVRHGQIVSEAEDFMLANLDLPITLKSLCRAINTSDRPLFYGFKNIFGLSPMAFLKVQRLQVIRHTLQSSEPGSTTVREVAERFGFWNSGHFARDYKVMFGEQPSDTLNQPGRN